MLKGGLLLGLVAATSGTETSNIFKVDFPEKGYCGLERHVEKAKTNPHWLFPMVFGGFTEGLCEDVGYTQYLKTEVVELHPMPGVSHNRTFDIYGPTQTETIDVELKDPSRANKVVKFKLCRPKDIGTTPHPHPLLIFGHGAGCAPDDYQYFCQTAATAMIYADSPAGKFFPADFDSPSAALDAKFLSTELLKISHNDTSSPLYKKLDGRVVIGGHSMGGGMSVLSVGMDNTPVDGMALFAPGLYTTPSATPYLGNITVPTMIVSGSYDCGQNALDKQAQPAFDGLASKKKVLVVLKGANHCQWTQPFEKYFGICKAMIDSECNNLERRAQHLLGASLAHNFMWGLQGDSEWEQFEYYLREGERVGTFTYISSHSSPKGKTVHNECPCTKEPSSEVLPSRGDLQRAKTKKPREAFKGADQAGLSKVLNKHLVKAESRTKACDEWKVEELQAFMATIYENRNEALNKVYEATNDRRQLFHSTTEQYKSLWGSLNKVLSEHPHLLEPQKESHCREAVLWWTHHISDEKRVELRARNVTVPLLPEGPKKACGQTKGEHPDVLAACKKVEKPNSCDWCHSTQQAHDALVPGTSALNALDYPGDGPDDGNPHNWTRDRRCDQDQLPPCQLCEGVGGYAWHDNVTAWTKTPCEIVAHAKDVDKSTVAPPLYPKRWTVQRKDGKKGGYSDTLIGWEVMNSCFSFFPQNDSIGPLCYRSQESIGKWYDIEREATRTDYTLHLAGIPPTVPNTTSTILQVGEQMWVVNDIAGAGNMQCVCTNPSGQHCTNYRPCYSYTWHWDTFATAQYLGREKIGVEWIQNHGVGNSSKTMELDHFIMWSHHIWTDPVSRRLVRAWKPFNGLQVYDPEAWTDDVEDLSIFETPPPVCASALDKPGAAEVWRINCDEHGNYNGTDHSHRMFGEVFTQQIKEITAKVMEQFAKPTFV